MNGVIIILIISEKFLEEDSDMLNITIVKQTVMCCRMQNSQAYYLTGAFDCVSVRPDTV